MKTVTYNECDFSEIFRFAEKNHGISWNKCNDVFFRSLLDYEKHNDFELEFLEADLEEDKFYQESYKLATTILIDFMKENKVTEMRVMNG